ncbi:MAG: amino acid permease, partial [Gammaproteobacteria bacterium]|nr:amino acid permease [Gammaproteobacteria bacterium]
LYLIMYALLFASGIILRYKRPDAARTYKVPGGKLGMWIAGGVGLISVAFGLFVSFIPPDQLKIGDVFWREALIVAGIAALAGIGLLIYSLRHPSWVINTDTVVDDN